MGITARRLTDDDWPQWRELRLSALATDPHAFGSRLADWQGSRDTERRWRDRLSSVPFNVIADLDATPAGMVSAVVDGSDVELISMWVAPFARGKGVGDALIGAVVRWADTIRPSRIVLRVRDANERAKALYRRHGFTDAGPADSASPDEPPERWMVRGKV